MDLSMMPKRSRENVEKLPQQVLEFRFLPPVVPLTGRHSRQNCQSRSIRQSAALAGPVSPVLASSVISELHPLGLWILGSS